MGILFSILSPALFGINNYIEKFLLEKQNISSVSLCIFEGSFAFLIGLIILSFNGFYHIDAKTFIILVSSGLLTILYQLPYFKALTLDETSNVIPLFQFYPIFVLILSFIILGESLTIMQYLGSLIIIVSGFALSVERFQKKTFRIRKSFFYMILSSFIVGLSLVLYKMGIQEVPFWHSLPYESLGIAIGTFFVALYKSQYKIFVNEVQKLKRKSFVVLTINQLVYIASRYTGYFAISLIAVGLVSILSGFQPLFVIVYGIVLSLWFPHLIVEVVNKKVLTQKLTTTILMFIGLYMIFG